MEKEKGVTRRGMQNLGLWRWECFWHQNQKETGGFPNPAGALLFPTPPPHSK